METAWLSGVSPEVPDALDGDTAPSVGDPSVATRQMHPQGEDDRDHEDAGQHVSVSCSKQERTKRSHVFHDTIAEAKALHEKAFWGGRTESHERHELADEHPGQVLQLKEQPQGDGWLTDDSNRQQRQPVVQLDAALFVSRQSLKQVLHGSRPLRDPRLVPRLVTLRNCLPDSDIRHADIFRRRPKSVSGQNLGRSGNGPCDSAQPAPTDRHPEALTRCHTGAQGAHCVESCARELRSHQGLLVVQCAAEAM